jgi:hypothetical protein
MIFCVLESKKNYYCKKKSQGNFLRIYLRKCDFCEISYGFICEIIFSGEFPAGITAELPADIPQENLLRICSRFRKKIPQENFLRIPKIAGNNYLQRF